MGAATFQAFEFFQTHFISDTVSPKSIENNEEKNSPSFGLAATEQPHLVVCTSQGEISFAGGFGDENSENVENKKCSPQCSLQHLQDPLYSRRQSTRQSIVQAGLQDRQDRRRQVQKVLTRILESIPLLFCSK